MCSGSEAVSYLRLIDVVYHSTLGLRVIQKKKGVYPRRGPPPVREGGGRGGERGWGWSARSGGGGPAKARMDHR